MHKNRPRARRILVIAAAVVLIASAISAWWWMFRPRNPDCATSNEMLNFSKTENDRMRTLIPQALDDPQKIVDAYQQREDRMHHYIDQIRDPDLHEKAAAIVTLDDSMLDMWRKTVPGQPQYQPGGATAGDAFTTAYARYDARRDHAAQQLRAACPAA